MKQENGTMIIVALTREGSEYTYNRFSAHKVSKASAEKIRNALNENRYRIIAPDMKWHVYEIDKYSPAYDIGRNQSFTIRNGYLYERDCYTY